MSPENWGGLYEKVINIYSHMLKRHGVLPSLIDKEKVTDFILIMQDEDCTYMNIDEVGGW